MSDHPFDRQFEALVRHLQLKTLPPFEAEVLAQDGALLDLRLVLAEEQRVLWELDRGFQGVPLALQGCWAVQLAPGARVVLEFLDGDRRKPVVRSVISGQIQQADLQAGSVKVDGTTIAIGPGSTTVALGKGLSPVAALGDPVVLNTALIGQPKNAVVKV